MSEATFVWYAIHGGFAGCLKAAFCFLYVLDPGGLFALPFSW